MHYRPLGRTGLDVSQLGFGCGSIGGLLVRGDYPTMRRVVGRAIELGVTYFDTASLYGDGQSEVNLGAVLRELRSDVLVGTKVLLAPGSTDRIEAAVVSSVEGSLRRLGREPVDLIQLHNPLMPHGRPDWASVTANAIATVFHAFQSLERQGKVRFWGITGLGETETLHQAVAGGGLHTVQVVYNLLNPSPGRQVPAGFPYQDYRQLIDRAADKQMGVIAIRILAGGALSGTPGRHPVAAQSVNPIATEPDYAADVARALRFAFLVQEGIVSNLVEAAIRFVISKPEISTALVGISSPEQLEYAVACANRGPLPADALRRIHDIQSQVANA
jgi:aryl-alcohol dehydrogenase-like predicted oxidoreductase